MKNPTKTDHFAQFNKVGAIDGNVIKNRSKDVAVCYRLHLPEIFTMGEPEFDLIHSDFLKALMVLPEGTIIHKKDIFKQKIYNSDNLQTDTYLQKSTADHFKGRIYINHECILSFILPEIPSLRKSYDKLSILTKRNSIAAIEEIEQFINTVEQSISVINSSSLLKAEPLTEDEIYEVILDEYTLFKDEVGDYVSNGNDFKIGDSHVKILSLRNDGQQKDGILNNCVLDRNRSTDNSRFFRSYCYPLALDFKKDHIYNQFIFIEDQSKIKKQLELNSKRLGSSRLLSRKNRLLADQNSVFLDSVEKDNVKIVRMHTNLVFWADSKEELKDISNKVSGYYSQMDILPYNNSHFDRDYIYLANHLGNAALLPVEETFLSYLDISLCYFSTETNYKSDDSGILFNDRISNIPLYTDVFHKPYEKKEILNRNYFMVAPSGGGKSFLSKNKLRQQIENPLNNTVVLNVGGDDKLCRMYPEDTIYFEYKEGQPLQLNPFWAHSNQITIGKIEFLTDFIGLLWKTGEDLNNDEKSSLDKVIIKFYNVEGLAIGDIDAEDDNRVYKIKNTHNKSLPKFYNYLLENSVKIKEETYGLFKLDSLILNLEKYAVGMYSNLFITGEPQTFESKKYVEFELDNIKDHPILFPIFGMIISDLVFNTMWKKDDSEKDFFVDEAWKVLEKKGMVSLLKYLFKTIRKFDGSVGIAIQQITDLIPLGETNEAAIIGNTAIKYILDHRDVLGDVPILQKKLSLSNADVSMLLSIKNNTKPNAADPLAYTEFLFKKGSTNAKVLRLEVAKPCLAIYESDKKKLKTFNALYNYHHQKMIPAIDSYIEVEIDKTKLFTDYIF